MDARAESQDQGELAFLHDSIRDYFAAEYMQKCWARRPRRTQLYVRWKRWDRTWGEIIALLSGLLEDPDILLRTLTRPLWWDLLIAQLTINSALVVAARCAEAQPGDITRYGQKFLNRLVRMAHSRNRFAKVSALEGLAAVEWREAVETIIECFTKSFADGDRAMAEHIIQAAADGCEEAQLAVIRALGEIDENENRNLASQGRSIVSVMLGSYFRRLNSVRLAEEVVKVCFECRNTEIRKEVSRVLSMTWTDLLPPKAFPRLVRAAIFDESDEVRRNAGDACWRQFPSETERLVLQMLRDSACSPVLRHRVISTTWNYVSISPTLREELKKIILNTSEPSSMRVAVFWPSFLNCGSEGKKELLEKCVQDPASDVRAICALSIATMVTHSYDEYLFQLLCDGEAKVSEAAAHALIKYGDATTIGRLKALLRTDVSADVAVIIQNTISAIKQTLLFGVDCLCSQFDLADSAIPEPLKQEFEDNGRPLPGYYQVAPISHNTWVINCGDGFYIVEKERNRANVYDKAQFFHGCPTSKTSAGPS